MAKPNYSFEKRQRELAKKKKKEEKDREKAARKAAGLPPVADDETDADADDPAERGPGDAPADGAAVDPEAPIDDGATPLPPR